METLHNRNYPEIENRAEKSSNSAAYSNQISGADAVVVGTRSSASPSSTVPAPNTRSNKPVSGPFSCNICQRSYSRVDHLARHFRSHTSEKAYTCSVCLKSFSRSDLLKRHAAAHTDHRRHQKSKSFPTKRVSQACKACAQAKLKCKETKPCQRCVSKGVECEYSYSTNKDPSSWRDESIVSQTMDADPLTGNEDMSIDDQHFQDWTATISQPVDGDTNQNMNVPPTLANDTSLAGNEYREQDENLFATFLRDIMIPTNISGYEEQAQCHTTDYSTAYRDLFSFGLDSDLDLTDQDYSIMDFYQGKPATQPHNTHGAIDSFPRYGPPTPQSDVSKPSSSDSLALGAEAFRRSLWKWTPPQEDSAYAEQRNFRLQPRDTSAFTSNYALNMNITPLEPDQRDQIIAMILSTCQDRSSFMDVITGFPSVALLNNLMHSFLASHLSQSDIFIHVPTLDVKKLRPELVGGFLASGALLSSSPTIRKLGFAIHESTRLSLSQTCEHNNSVTRDLNYLQALSLDLDFGLWSGNKRRKELSESHGLIFVTMCRRAGRMLRSSYPPIRPLESDTGGVLEEKWRAWSEHESLKRLVFHLFIRDAQTSISLLVPNLVSYAEMSLPFPSHQSLFLAPTAVDWKNIYLAMPSIDRLPSLPQCLHDLTPLTTAVAQQCVDTALCFSIVAYGFWGLLLEYITLNSIIQSNPPPTQQLSSSGLVLGHRHQELCQLLHHFSVSLTHDTNQPSSTTTTSRNTNSALPCSPATKDATIIQTHLLSSLLLTHLHVSFNDIQLFAGREGEEESRRVYPSLQTWVTSREARTAVWHAGQVIRYAKLLSNVREFFAVAVYHASLTFWAYGVLSLREYRDEAPVSVGMGDSGIAEESFVYIDAEEGEGSKRFIALGRGVPVFQGRSSGGERQERVAKLSEPWEVMDTIIEILTGKGKTMPTLLVENLNQLIGELGVAARAVVGV